MRVAANLAAAVSLCFGLLAFTTMAVLRHSVRDAQLTAVSQAADLLAFQLAHCSDDACSAGAVAEARRIGFSLTFHDRASPRELPQWIPAAPGWPAHVTVERRVRAKIIAVEMPLSLMAARSQAGMTALVLSLIFNAIALILIGLLFLERSVVRRLARVHEQLGTIERLDLETPLWSSDDGDEIGRMSGTLRRVTEKLREDKRRTLAYIEELQQTNKALRETQEGLARSDRLATVGRLAAGVAHEIGNPIAAILGYVEILRTGTGAPPREYADRIEREARRVDRIVRDLLDFARPQPLSIGPVSVAVVVQAAARLVQPQPRWRSMKLSIQLPPDLPMIAAQEHYATQVLLNLLINAADAADGRGEVTITARVVAEAVQVEVADDGPGIPQDNLGRIFDPFFTTKPPGQGTGLGLSICHRLMETFGGAITVGRREPAGAVFTLRFRTYNEQASTRAA